MKECSKSIQRRLHDANFCRFFFCGVGIDIGGKPDPLVLYRELFPFVQSIRTWDMEDGDAQQLAGLDDNSFDFVHSSHCLEHLNDPLEGLQNWLRVAKPGGYLVITVPDEDLYEQGVFPSTFNADHKWTFTISKTHSWSERSINLIDLVKRLGPGVELVKIELLVSTYRFEIPRYDQTLTPVGESGIEMIMRKRTEDEVRLGGRLRGTTGETSQELTRHLNQYRDDLQTLKSANKKTPPFQNDRPLD